MNSNNQISIPMIKDSEPCGYFKDKTSTVLLTTAELMQRLGGYEVDDSVFYGFLLTNGFRRQNKLFYLDQCEGCKECIPIRIPVEDFQLSKSQKRVWNKNNDIEVKISDSSQLVTEEKAFIFREYDRHHNGENSDYKVMTNDEAFQQLKNMNSGYSAILNMDYYLDNSLIGVGILDLAQDNMGNPIAISSNYFYYLPEEKVLNRSLGVFSVLKEIEFCSKLKIPYYYLGLYLPNCRKMNYKTNYKTYELFKNGIWQREPVCD